MSAVSEAKSEQVSYPLGSWICLAIVWIVWGSTYLGIRVAVQAIPPFLMAGSRYLIAGALLAVVLAIVNRGRLPQLDFADVKSILSTAILLLVIGNGALSYTEVQLESGIAAIIVATVPIWMLLIESYRSGSVKPLGLLGVAIGSIGIITLFGIPSVRPPLVPAVILLVSTISWAFGSVRPKNRKERRFHPLFPALEMIVAGVMLSAVGLATGETQRLHLSAIGPGPLAGFLWLVFGGSIIAYSAYGYVIRTLPTTVVATYAYINPVIAVALGALILHEPLTINVVVGGGAIIVAVIVILLANRTIDSDLERGAAPDQRGELLTKANAPERAT